MAASQVSHLTNSSNPSAVIVLCSTDFCRTSVRQSLPHNTSEDTPRKLVYCDQEARKSKKSSAIVLYGVTAFVFAHLSMESRRAVGRGTLEVTKMVMVAPPHNSELGYPEGRSPAGLSILARLENGYHMDDA